VRGRSDDNGRRWLDGDTGGERQQVQSTSRKIWAMWVERLRPVR